MSNLKRSRSECEQLSIDQLEPGMVIEYAGQVYIVTKVRSPFAMAKVLGGERRRARLSLGQDTVRRVPEDMLTDEEKEMVIDERTRLAEGASDA